MIVTPIYLELFGKGFANAWLSNDRRFIIEERWENNTDEFRIIPNSLEAALFVDFDTILCNSFEEAKNEVLKLML